MAEPITPDGRALEDLFEALFLYGGDPVLLAGAEGAVLRANPAACKAFGRAEADIRQVGRAGIAVPGPELDRLLDARARLGIARGELVLRRADGTTFPAEVTTTLVPTAAGDPVALVVFRDVSERRRLEEALRASEARFRAAFDALPDAAFLSESDSGLFLAVSSGARAVTGWEPADLVGKSSVALSVWGPGDREVFVRRLRAEGAVRDHEARLRRKDGSLMDALLSARPLRLGDRELLITVVRDVTEQRRAERERDAFLAQLRESQKLESVGRLAGGVAHDFNNLLSIIIGCGGALEEDLRRGASPDPEHLAELHAAAERARDLTRQLLAYASHRVPAPVALDLGEVVRRMERLLGRVLGEDVDLLVGTPREVRHVRCDPVQLEQVILNLAVNARDALPRGGKLLIEARNVQLDEAGAARFPGASPGPHVLLVVQDNGVGMPPEVRARAFEPFFTTKPLGQGTGLGLATVHEIVAQGGGFVRLDSAPGLGTKVEIAYPVVAAPGDAAAPPAPDAPAVTPAPVSGPGGSETVLVVEDDPRVREVTARILRQAGYRALDAGTGHEALGLLEQEPVDLVLSDVVMPLMNGRQLADRIRERTDPPRLLFMSGHPESVVHRRGLLDPGTPLVVKPFTAGALLTHVRAVLDRAT